MLFVNAAIHTSNFIARLSPDLNLHCRLSARALAPFAGVAGAPFTAGGAAGIARGGEGAAVGSWPDSGIVAV